MRCPGVIPSPALPCVLPPAPLPPDRFAGAAEEPASTSASSAAERKGTTGSKSQMVADSESTRSSDVIEPCTPPAAYDSFMLSNARVIPSYNADCQVHSIEESSILSWQCTHWADDRWGYSKTANVSWEHDWRMGKGSPAAVKFP